jgi:hypothetical protein
MKDDELPSAERRCAMKVSWQDIDSLCNSLGIRYKTHYQQLKQVPDFEIRNRLNELIDRLSKVTVLSDERDKHISKAKEILRRGW